MSKRKTLAQKLNLPTSPSAYKALGGKTRHYQIKSTGQKVSRRAYLTATRGLSVEQYTKLPFSEKKAPSRGGRGKPSSKILEDKKGKIYGKTYTWVIDYNVIKWARFQNQLIEIVNRIYPDDLGRFYVQIKGNGIFSTKSGGVAKKGRLKWISSEIFEISFIQKDGVQSTLELFIGDIDFTIVKKVRIATYPVPKE